MAVAVVAALALVEIAVRVRQVWKYGTSGAVHAKSFDPVSGLELYGASYEAGPVRINSMRFRGPEIEVPKPSGRVRLAFLGGSTTFCAEASGNEATWPALVRSRLQSAHPAATFDYVNAGVGGFGVNECLTILETRVRALSPDVIVIYEATNDLTRDTRDVAKAQGLFQEPVETSWIARWLVSWRLVEFNLKYRAQIERARHAPTIAVDPARVADPFRARLEKLVRACSSAAPVVAVATFSHQVRREQPPEQRKKACESSQFYMPWMSVDGLLDGFDAYNAAIRDVARAEKTLLIEGENDIPGDARHFADSVHLTDLGCSRMADRVAKALDASDAFRRLVDERAKR